MSELPAGWVEVMLGEIASDCTQRIPDRESTFTYIDIASVDRETKQITSAQELVGAQAPSRARKIVRTGDVLVSMTRPNLNAVALVPPALDGQIASTGFDVLRPLCGEPRWIFNIVRSKAFVNAMSDLVQGALYPAVRSKDVRGFRTPLAPLPEQKRIADKLDALLARVDACRERLGGVFVLLKRLRQAAIDQACAPAFVSEHASDFPTDRRAWTMQRVESLAVAGGIFDGARDHGTNTPVALNLRTADYTESGVRVIRLENLGHLRFNDGKRTYISEMKYKGLRQNEVGLGDVLVGSFIETELRVCAVPLLDTPAISKADCFCVRPRSDRVLAEFLALQLATSRTFSALAKSVRGATRPRITTKHLRELEIPICSLQEQAEIVELARERLSAISAIELAVQRVFERTGRLPAAILAKAFRGELVPQDPNDEPAEALLRRAKATARRNSIERNQRSGKPKVSRRAVHG